jgi:capsular exopolysaccharide synthesis family protein
MDNQSLLEDPSGKRQGPGTSLTVPPQYAGVLSTEPIDEPTPGFLLEYWGAIRRHQGTLVLSAFFGLLLAVLFTLPQTPIYRARASIEIQNLNENFLNMRNVNPTTDDDNSSAQGSDLQTQVKILQSESILEGVVTKLNLEKKLNAERDRGRVSAWRNALGLAPKSAMSPEAALSVASKNLKVQTVAGTRLIDIFYDSTDPQLAADFANALTGEFIQQNLEVRWKTTRETGEWLTRQMEDVRIKLEKSEDELQRYAGATGLLFTSEKSNVAEDKLRQLQEELSRAQADRVVAQSKYESASSASAASLPEVLDDKTLGEYQVKLTDLRRQLAELSSSMKPTHPAVKKVQAEIAAVESALESKRGDIVQRMRNEYQAARRRESLLAGSYAAQARLVAEQAAKVAHYNILKREVDSNRELYDSLLRNVQEAGMTSALRSTNIRVVDHAKPPKHPYKPSLVMNSALGLLAGAFFGFVFIRMRERADRSIRAPGEAQLSLGVPELGVIPSAGAERSRYFAYYRPSGKGIDGAGNGTRDSRPGSDSGSGSRDSGNGSLTTLGLGSTDDAQRKSDARPLTSGKRLLAINPIRVELAASRRTPSVLAESFQATLTSLLFTGENGDRPRVIVLTSAGPGEGKTTMASNLALALSEGGPRVLLIDGDMRKGRLHEIFQVSNAWGLSDVLAGKALPLGRTSIYLETRYSHLCLLPSGSTPAGIASLLRSPRTREFLKQARDEFHTVLIDSPPMLNMADARVLGKVADGVILVVRSAETTRDTIVAAAQRLREDGSRVLGTILNEWDPRKSSNAGYAYAYPYYRSRTYEQKV